MVNLTRIYTRTGDDGTTSLGDMSRTDKNDLRLLAFADVDEANSSIGSALALGDVPPEIADLLREIQNDLFDVGADLCTPVVEDPAVPPLRVTQAYVDALEGACDEHNARLEPLRSFVLPGGTKAAALLHIARTVVRRAERATWAALAVHAEAMNPLTATYLNRLSDLLFILAREANTPALDGGGDILWRPGLRQG
jgi:cob(I)alamin adenosyltransferase